MELFTSGQLTQVELLPLCQELIYLKQQLDEAQIELKQIQVAQQAGTMPTPAEGSYELPPTIYAPPPPSYETQMAGDENLTPPPPPGIAPITISAMSTVIMDTPSPTPSAAQPEKRLCPACKAELQPEFAFCQNCGTLVKDTESQHLPTARAGMPELAFPSSEQTVRGEETSSTPGDTTPPLATDSIS